MSDEDEPRVGEASTLGPLLRAVSAAPAVDPELRPGARLGRAFRVVRLVGRGGMGRVYLGHDEKLDRPVALKVALFGAEDRERARLLDEARAAARVAHPNVVSIYEVGTDPAGDRIYIAMEWVGGGTLRSWLATGPTPRAIRALLVEAGRGLAAVHASARRPGPARPRPGRPIGLGRPAAAGRRRPAWPPRARSAATRGTTRHPCPSGRSMTPW
jgi:hypothetical protein